MDETLSTQRCQWSAIRMKWKSCHLLQLSMGNDNYYNDCKLQNFRSSDSMSLWQVSIYHFFFSFLLPLHFTGRSVASSSTTGSGEVGSVTSNGLKAKVVDSSDGTVFVRVENKQALADDLRLLASLPELCDVTFLVGDERQPICGVRAILAARSR